MKVIYVAGPFRAANHWEIEQNIRRAETLSLEVWKAGFAAICPHANTRFYQGAAPDHVWLDGDLEILKRCDAVLLAPNWQNSTGTLAERDFAFEHNIPVFYSLPDLLAHWACDRSHCCALAPAGWSCKREIGHDGPCAAVPE